MIPHSMNTSNGHRSQGRGMVFSQIPDTTVDEMKHSTIHSYRAVLQEDIESLSPEHIRQLILKLRILNLYETINHGLKRLHLSFRRFSEKMNADQVDLVYTILHEARMVRNSAAHCLEPHQSTVDLEWLLASLTVLTKEFVRVFGDWLSTTGGREPLWWFTDDFLRFWRNNHELDLDR